MYRVRTGLKLSGGVGISLLTAHSSSTSFFQSSKMPSAAPPSVTFYQYEPCPYCCKTKAVMDFLKVPYKVVEVNPLNKKELKAITDYNKVPVAVLDGEVG
jgi:microsomal prostaglandin-E synthase 2